MTTPEVDVRVPGLLTRFTDGRQTVQVRAATVGGCLEALLESYPALGPHLYDGHGDLRTHLRLFLNGEEIEPVDADGVETAPTDEVVVLQAVSGGGRAQP